jgi:hypothetical protein
MLFLLFWLKFIIGPKIRDIIIHEIVSVFIWGLHKINIIRGIIFCVVRSNHKFVGVCVKRATEGSQLCTGALAIFIIRASSSNILGLLLFVTLLISILNSLKIRISDAVLCVKK